MRLCLQDLRRCLDILLTNVVYWVILLYLWFFDDYKYSKKHYQKSHICHMRSPKEDFHCLSISQLSDWWKLL